MSDSDSSECNNRTAGRDIEKTEESTDRGRHVNHEFDKVFISEEHVADFARALGQDSLSGSEGGPEHISAASALAPPKRKRRAKEEDINGTPKGISYTLLRYPLIVSKKERKGVWKREEEKDLPECPSTDWNRDHHSV